MRVLAAFEDDDEDDDAVDEDLTVEGALMEALSTPITPAAKPGGKKGGSAKKARGQSDKKLPSGAGKRAETDAKLDERVGHLELGLERLMSFLERSEAKEAAVASKVQPTSLPKMRSVDSMFEHSSVLREPVTSVVIGGRGEQCHHPKLVKSYEARQRKRAKVLQRSYYFDDDGEDGTTGSRKLSKAEMLNACQSREFVECELGTGDFDTVIRYVRANKFKLERNRQECEFIGSTLDALVRDVAGGDYEYLCGSDVFELLIRRLQGVMTADAKGNQKKSWNAVRAYMAPVQGVSGVFMNPSVWSAADKEGGLYGDPSE